MRWFFWPAKLPQQPSGRMVLSWVFASLQLIFAVIHGFSFLVYPLHPSTVRIVAYIQSLGPIWVYTFGGTSALLIASLLSRRLLPFSHSTCAGVWAGYAAALWVGALADKPAGVVSFPILATVITIGHVVLGLASVDLRG